MAEPTELLAARHGEAWCNREQTIGGMRTCRGLTPEGRQQAERLAARLANAARPVDVIYTTPLRRASETAGLLGDVLGVEPIVEPGLREPDYGAAEGLPWDKAVADFGDAPSLYPDRPIAAGAESWLAFLARARAAIAAILDRHGGEKILIVAHGETIAAAHHHFAGVPSGEVLPVSFACHPTAVTTWQQQPLSWTMPGLGWRWALAGHNDVRHLG
ncbi:histidine phosphatase family protein [Nonomuraea sp. NPDC050536]|uniref:histidine phosphatase family protein n=1 Tax=Nonomuraea sp. NPDC050536 TaxID=3364366 RepID=UPI0037C9916C